MIGAVTAIVLALACFSLEVRTIFHGAVLTRGITTDAEQYTYSAVWLAFGAARSPRATAGRSRSSASAWC